MRGSAASLVALFAAVAMGASLSASESTYPIDVVVTGATPGSGQILVSLFDSPDTYLKAPLVEARAAVDAEGSAVIHLGAVPPGEYGIVAIHDENGNGMLDTGLFRIPKELIGYSNNPRGRLGPATWDDVRFVVTDSSLVIDVSLSKAK